DVDLDAEAVDASAFDPTGARLAVFRGRNRLMLWDTAERREGGSCVASLEAGQSAVAVAVSSDGSRAAAAIYDGSPGRGGTGIRVWSLPDCAPVFRVEVEGRPQRIALSPDGAHLASGGASAVRIWDVASRT